MGFVFNRGALYLQNQTVVWTTADIRARLSRTTEILDNDADTMTGLGLATTDRPVTGALGPTLDDATNRVIYTADAVAFPIVAEGAQVDKIIVFAFVTDDASSIPLAVMDMTPPIIPNGGGITVNVPAAGMFFTQQ